MRKYWFAAILAALVIIASGVRAEVLFLENFDYDAGVLSDTTGQANVSGGVWHHFSGTGFLIQCVDGNLSYPSYQASNIGRMIRITAPTGSAEDIYAEFTPIMQGSVMFASFLLNIIDTLGIPRDTSTNGEYFVSFLPNNSTTLYLPRLLIRQGTTPNTYVLGIRPTGQTNSIWGATEYNPGTTHLLVIKHALLTGSGNDITSLFVDPDLSGSEPPSTINGTASSGDTTNNIARFAVRQNRVSNSTRTPNANIDGIIVATSWSDIVGVAGSPSGLTNGNFSLAPINPNPVTKATQIKYSLSTSVKVNLTVFNILGQQVATLVNGYQSAGSHAVTWKLRDDRGSLVPNGVYFIKLSANGQSIARRAMVIR